MKRRKAPTVKLQTKPGANDTTIHNLVFWWEGKRHWKSAGTDARDAERQRKRLEKSLRDGTYAHKGKAVARTFGTWMRQWLDDRRVRKPAEEERAALERHVLSREWLAHKPLADVTQNDLEKLSTELITSKKALGSGAIGAGTARNMFALVRACLRNAKKNELIESDPYIEKGTIFYEQSTSPRQPYELHEVKALLENPKVSPIQRVWIALAFFTGGRLGEINGFRWDDWKRDVKPLTAIYIRRQYDDRPLKTERVKNQKPRSVPVHPVLERVLSEWHASGFHLTFGEKPYADAPIVPAQQWRPLRARTRAGSYRQWVTGCARAEVLNRSVHSTRHTFVTLCLRGGADRDVVREITHRNKKEMLDVYNHTAWGPMCEAVLAWGMTVDRPVDEARKAKALALVNTCEWSVDERKQAETNRIGAPRLSSEGHVLSQNDEAQIQSVGPTTVSGSRGAHRLAADDAEVGS